MIKKLNESHKDLVVNYLSREAAINLFLLGDIENFGFDKDFIDLWGNFDESENLIGVLLRFYDNFIPYSQDSKQDFHEFKEIISSHSNTKIISGKKSIVDNFKEIFTGYKEEICYFSELTNKNDLLSWNDKIVQAGLNDIDEIYDFENSIEEFKDIPSNKESIKNTIESKGGRIYCIKDDNNHIISIAQTSAENSKSAMIVSVCTKKEYRNRGLVTQCLSKLCNDLLNEGKTLCLFYDNPQAAKIYHKLGFKPIDKWTMLISKN